MERPLDRSSPGSLGYSSDRCSKKTNGAENLCATKGGCQIKTMSAGDKTILNGEVKNGIDYILSSKKKNVKDVTAINKISTGSDHGMMPARIKINKGLERKSFMTMQTPILDQNKLKEKTTDYQEQTKTELNKNEELENNNIEEIKKILTTALIEEGQQ
ncbi:hypothetical protein ILUMI_00845, partial [Ignelater luminosus]